MLQCMLLFNVHKHHYNCVFVHPSKLFFGRLLLKQMSKKKQYKINCYCAVLTAGNANIVIYIDNQINHYRFQCRR